MKKYKNIAKYTLLILICILFTVGCISFGFYLGKQYAEDEYENQKGNGAHFYVETFDKGTNYFKGMPISNEMFIYHSTPNCPNIKYGTLRDIYYNDIKRVSFCPHCMDDELIERFNAHLEN